MGFWMCFCKNTWKMGYCDSVLCIQLVNLLPSLSLFDPLTSLMHVLFWTSSLLWRYEEGQADVLSQFLAFREDTRPPEQSHATRNAGNVSVFDSGGAKKNTFLSFWQLGMYMNWILHEPLLFASQPYHWGSLGWSSRTTRSRLMTHSYCSFRSQSRRISTSSQLVRSSPPRQKCLIVPGFLLRPPPFCSVRVHLLLWPLVATRRTSSFIRSLKSLLRFAKRAVVCSSFLPPASKEEREPAKPPFPSPLPPSPAIDSTTNGGCLCYLCRIFNNNGAFQMWSRGQPDGSVWSSKCVSRYFDSAWGFIPRSIWPTTALAPNLICAIWNI